MKIAENEVFIVTKQPKMREHSANTDFSLNRYVLVIFISVLPPSLTSCILNVVDIFRDEGDVTSSTTRQGDSDVPRLYIPSALEK